MKPQTLITVSISVATFIFGSIISGVGIYWKMRDRMAAEIKEAVTEQIQTESRLTDLENLTEKNREDIYFLKTKGQ